jgi:hypothetical protein
MKMGVAKVRKPFFIGAKVDRNCFKFEGKMSQGMEKLFTTVASIDSSLPSDPVASPRRYPSRDET